MTPELRIDVAHPPRPGDAVEEALGEALDQVRNSPVLRVIKIVHGYGSKGKGGTTKEVVRNWAFVHRTRFKGIINGEEHSLTNLPSLKMRSAVGQYPDSDLTSQNPGITILWVR
jgi:hypothetical protein